MAITTAHVDPGPIVAAAIELLARQGFEATSVEELADAAGISRSTFFRKFGSKEDVVFADHDRILAQVQQLLDHRPGDPLAAVVEAALLVFSNHVRNRDTSLRRHELLRQVPALRDRELVMTHRYERAFRRHLQAHAPGADGGAAAGVDGNAGGTGSASPAGASDDAGGAEAVAFAASVVAVHNAALRHWLRTEAAEPPRGSGGLHAGDAEEAGGSAEADSGAATEAETAAGAVRRSEEASAKLEVQLRALAARFRPAAPASGSTGSGAVAGAPRSAVVVTVLDPAAGTEEILKAVRNALQ
ncbi:TetR/AcrR family transcriptional regulator [Arthrobacter sp. 35W]|uniref:TetR/AcrR family transcriptional regulator n=1 Tax=Arthrobacter sp. 35W TaxID=1132441 RepID=UPI000420EEB7|nr:TetR/AcrR family transcriptional regulator [Arthrobacter sp. 35W]